MRPFVLSQPGTLAEAASLLDPDDPTTRPIAGGTALMLMMKAGVFSPSRLVSLRKVERRYASCEIDADGAVRIGALTTLRQLEQAPALISAFPVFGHTLPVLSNVRVRNVATVGGALAHGDPHMDLPPVLMALDAEVTAVSPRGERRIALGNLLTGYYETSLEPDELIGEVYIPAQPGRRTAYVKCTTRSADDWPALGVAVSILAEDGTIKDARIVVSAASEKADRVATAEAALEGAAADHTSFRTAGEAAAAEVDVIADIRGTAPYKRQLIRVNVARALAKAVHAASGTAH